MFERFTERARKVIVLAQDEARRFNHDYVGTEHLLLGLLKEEHGIAGRVLRELGVSLGEAREQVESIVGYGEEGTGAQAPFTPRSKKVLELALREALQLGHNYIGTEHILLGLVRESEGVAARVSLNLGVDTDEVRREIVRRLPGEDPGIVLSDEAWLESEERRVLFRGRVDGIRARALHPDDGNPVRYVPLVVGLDYADHVVREGFDGFEALDHARLTGLVEGLLEARQVGLLETVAGLTGDLLLGEVPSIQEVTVTVTREDPPPGVSVSATFRR